MNMHLNYNLNYIVDLIYEHKICLSNNCLRGIERECLRIDNEGTLAMTPHPNTLGSSLTNFHITTDYAEALLEFITKTDISIANTIESLEKIHCFVCKNINKNEYLWSQSMPCKLPPNEKDIQIAFYGDSSLAGLKHIYRKGLGLRYGKFMQCIAGIHYNFSFPNSFFYLLYNETAGTCSRSLTLSEFQSEYYLGLIRNFLRYNWLLMYLFGASPATFPFSNLLDKNKLKKLNKNTVYLPYATSLRMSDVGYNKRTNLKLCYNSMNNYIFSLRKALITPCYKFKKIGTKHNGEWIQLNTNILQSENEDYSSIRPKRVTSNERLIKSLASHGIQYIEIRCIDINPFLPLGIDYDEIMFFDAFILYCAFTDSPLLDTHEYEMINHNFMKTVKEGRRPNLKLLCKGKSIILTDWAYELLEKINNLILLLDYKQYIYTLAKQKAKIIDSELTVSAQVLRHIDENNETFESFSLSKSKQHTNYFRNKVLSLNDISYFKKIVNLSIEKQKQLEKQKYSDIYKFIQEYNSL